MKKSKKKKTGFDQTHWISEPIPFYCKPFDPDLGHGATPQCISESSTSFSEWASEKAGSFGQTASFWENEANNIAQSKDLLIQQIAEVQQNLPVADEQLKEELKELSLRRSEFQNLCSKTNPKESTEKLNKLNQAIQLLQESVFPVQLKHDTDSAHLGELQAKLAHLESKRRNALEQACRYRRREEFWNRLSQNPDGLKSEIIQRLQKEDCFAYEMLCGLAEKDSESVEVLSQKIYQYLEPTIEAARLGNEKAAGVVAELAIRCTGFTNGLAEESPSSVRSVASKTYKWPIIKTKRNATREEEKEFLSKIKLGDPPFLQDRVSRTQLNDLRGRIALELFSYLFRTWEGVRFWKTQGREFLHSFTDLESRIGGLEFFNAEKKSSLPVDKKIIGTWWEVAEEVLKAKWPSSKDVPELQNVVALGHQKIPGKFNSQFTYEIRRRFYRLGGQAYGEDNEQSVKN